MKKLAIIILALLALAHTACKEDANNWPVDPQYDRPFRTTSFKMGASRPTAIQIVYNGVSDATHYIFEFSEGDSLEFNNIVKTVDIIADTLSTNSVTTSETAREYQTWFEDLKGLTEYSVRMKAVTATQGESHYVSFWFRTPEEQIFTDVVNGLQKATLFWEAEKEATNIQYAELNIVRDELGNLLENDTIWMPQIDLTPEQQQAGTLVISGLKSGTSYLASIYNGDNKRGTRTFKTLGRKMEATTALIEVTADMNVNDVMAEQVAAGQTDLMVVFKGGELYDFDGAIQVPAGTTSAYFIGDIDAGGTLPEVQAKELKLGSTLTNISFQYIDLNGNKKAGFFMNLSGNTFKHLTVDGCIIRNMNNCFVRLSGDLQGAEIVQIAIRNCEIQELSTSGWGVFNFNFSNGKLNALSLTNCTLRDIADQLMDVRVQLEQITVDRCLLCNFNMALPKVFLLGKQPGEIAVTNTIFCGDNRGTKINAGYGTYNYFDYTGCYVTSDLKEDSKPFTNATKLELTTEELFVDPRNGDFHIKPDVRFAGDGIAGPSKWWTEK